MPIKAIARMLRVSKNTVRRAPRRRETPAHAGRGARGGGVGSWWGGSGERVLGQGEGWWQVGAGRKALVWDNEGAVGSWRRGRPQLTDACVPRAAGLRRDPEPAPGPGVEGHRRAGG